MKILVYDPFAGISGDMHLGAMVDLGVPEKIIIDAVKSLNLEGWDINFTRVKRQGISGTYADVSLSNNNVLHHTHHHHHHHRTLQDIRKILTESTLDKKIIERSLRMFELLADAEGKIHGISPDKVHFHEVGALDSIIDIVGAAAAIEYLKPDKIYSRPPELGGGSIECDHGKLPVPAPATAELLKGIPVKTGGTDYEATTPTGAVILKANADRFINTGSFKIRETGYGAGKRDGDIPNLLRIFLAEASEEEKASNPAFPVSEINSEIMVFTCNIDDMNPEIYEHVINRLFESGAKEAYLTPVYMKKNRPGILLTAAAEPELADRIRDILFSETTTAGLRETRAMQSMLDRKTETISTKFGDIRIKKLYYRGECISSKPEYEDIKNAAKKFNMPMKEIYELIRK